MDISPPPPAIAERLAAVRASHQEFIRAYLNAARPAPEVAGKAFAEFARRLRETPPSPPRQDFMFKFQQTDGARELFAWVDEHIRVRQAATVDRLAADLGISAYVARRHFDAVQDVLEQAGVGDGYGGLTIPQPVRPPVQAAITIGHRHAPRETAP